MTDHELHLDTLLGGDALAEFQEELRAVAADILDPNKKATVARKVILEMTILPNENRDACTTSVQSYSKVPKPTPRTTILFVGKHHGRAMFSERDARQADMFDEEASKPQAPRVVDGGKE